ncbi:uncharacterized protein PV07_02144 [Cladophialophora immunda]|uniref:Transcription factor domain-containing protein n=1 Tax=Cladophialophora immunda TaxID=569365 RepID=A0A0D2BD72_9EURO|nr:uncharacterized protein PV07_02144 [Cladophialophora immunda]KIW35447.1 hypothetical protein PV07_02144 [Cladophialophora immunda]
MSEIEHRMCDHRVFVSHEAANAELQAELDELRQQIKSTSGQHNSNLGIQTLSGCESIHSESLSAKSGNANGGYLPSSPSSRICYDLLRSAESVSMESPQGVLSQNVEEVSNVAEGNPPTLPRSLQAISCSETEIDDCFALFFKRHQVHMPFLDPELTPNNYYERSELLFWTIVGIGSRKYSKNPTLITLLAPKVIEQVQSALFSRDNVVYTIQACILLCVDPMPFEVSSHDITHVLTGASMNMALNIGLHTVGTGQDFSREYLPFDQKDVEYRAKLWITCMVTCQRISHIKGLPPQSFAGTYDQGPQWDTISSTIPPSHLFQMKLCQSQSEAILAISRELNASGSALEITNSSRIKAAIDERVVIMKSFQSWCPSNTDRFYLLCAMLQLQGFHFYVPLKEMSRNKLVEMYDLACTAAELTVRLDEQEDYTESIPGSVLIYLQLVSFTILKLSRAKHLHSDLDLKRGQNAYFSLIQLHRRVFVLSNDAWSRATTIMTQLWTSKNAFRRRNGTYDSLSLRVRNRLGMGVVHDTWWWWRHEFSGFPDPYDHPSDAMPKPASELPLATENDVIPRDEVFEWPTQWTTASQDQMLLDIMEMDPSIWFSPSAAEEVAK